MAGGPSARAEHPGADQVWPNVFRDRWQEGRAATDDQRTAKHSQLVDEAELDRCRGQSGAASYRRPRQAEQPGHSKITDQIHRDSCKTFRATHRSNETNECIGPDSVRLDHFR